MIKPGANLSTSKEDTKLTDWPNEPTYKDLYQDYLAAEPSHSEFVAKLENNRINMEGGPAIKARTGKSTHRPLIIRKNAEWRYPMLSEPLLNTDDMFLIQPRTAEDDKPSEQNQLLINYYWATQVDKVKLVDEAARVFVDEGTVIIKTGWKAEEEIVEVEKEFPVYASPEESLMMMQQAVQSGQMSPEQAEAMIQTGEPVQTGVEVKLVEESRLVKNHPTYEVCQNENIILDPTACGVKENLKFLIHEYETDLSTLKDQEYVKEYIKTTDGKEEVRESGIYHNLDDIDLNADKGLEHVTEDTSSSLSNDFKFEDDARKKITAYEYWGEWDINGDGTTESIVATWVDKTLIRLELNPFPHKEIPFSIAAYMPRKGELRGQPDAELLVENQEMIGRMMRAANDITTTKAIGQKIVNEQLFSNSSEWDAYMAGNDARYQANMNPKEAIFQTNVEKVDPSLFEMINLYTQDAEAMTGNRGGSGGTAGGAYKNVDSVRSAMDASSKRELGILRRFTLQAFSDMGRKTVINQQVYASQEETLRITSTEFAVVRREDLVGEFDLTIDVSTPEAENEKAEKLNMLMQTNAASMDPNISKLIYSKIATLWKEPALAKQIEEYEPQPDPMEEEMKQIQLETAKLQMQKVQMEIANLAKGIEDTDSKIVERVSRAEENMKADIMVKQSQAQSLRAQAEKLMAEADKLASETDVIDKDFMHDYSGDKRELEELDKEFDAEVRNEDTYNKAIAAERQERLKQEAEFKKFGSEK